MKEMVKEYYGKVIQTTKDLKTSACCSSSQMPVRIKNIVNEIDKEILNRFYGCGSPIPSAIEECVVLDLGCGTGRDVYIVSAIVGESGKVIGVDMTSEQLDVAIRHIDSQMKKFGYVEPNVEFKRGYIEDLKTLGIEDNSVDVVISNCVINLSPDKRKVFSEIFRVLKPGGELFFSDVFTGRRVPDELKSDPVLVGECLGGALYIEDFRRMLRGLGCPDYRVVKKTRLTLNDPEVKEKAGMIDFYSMDVRAFKLDTLEDKREDYAQIATYLGTLEESPYEFVLDDHHLFKIGKPEPVCGNTASMIKGTRYARHFKVTGDRSVHYGLFPCGPDSDKVGEYGNPAKKSCC